MTDAELIKTIEDIGDAIKAEAVKMAGNHKYQTKLKILVEIPMDRPLPTIKVLQEFIPETNMKTERQKRKTVF